MIEPTVPTKLQHVRQSARQSESLSSVVKGGGKTSDALPHSINQWCRIIRDQRDRFDHMGVHRNYQSGKLRVRSVIAISVPLALAGWLNILHKNEIENRTLIER